MKKVKSANAFSLIEILVVISIIAVLSTLAVVSMQYAKTASKIAKARHDVDAIVLAMKLLENDTGQWPGHQDVDDVTSSGSNEIWDLAEDRAGLVATDGDFPGWNGPYMASIPLDPWGNRYFYDSDYRIGGVNRVVIGSFGPNGVGQNVYDSDDIYKVLR